VSASGLIVAAPSSGSGKTVVTAAVLRALCRGGVRVAPFKVGPDYIDPAFHAAASGRPCHTLDPWAMRPAMLARVLDAVGREADLVIGEGVMGLFDGASDGTGSTADLAALTGWAVVLVVDARGQGASVAALLRGFLTHRTDVEVAGVIFNRVGSADHGAMLCDAVAPLSLPVLGAVPRTAALTLPERHLGLVQAGEQEDLGAFLDGAADVVGRHVDLDGLGALARPAIAVASDDAGPPGVPLLGQRVAVARDTAFAFIYPALVEDWRAAGAEVRFFSPLADEAPADDADAVYLPGGYPELHAGRLAANARFMAGLRAAAARGAAVYGECGGYMVLGDGLVDAGGARHAMAGLLPLETSFAERRLHLGYRAVRQLADSPIGGVGESWRGHEFHYATILREGPAPRLFAAADARGRALGEAGLAVGRVCGSFVHLIDRAAPAKRLASAGALGQLSGLGRTPSCLVPRQARDEVRSA
jgi:cobyrinic acid a,c-diamide synthase